MGRYTYFTAIDDSYGHAPDSGWNYVYGTWEALDKFEEYYGVEMIDDWWFGCWDLIHPFEVGSSSEDALDDLILEVYWSYPWMRDSDNEIVLGWADNLDKNGIAEGDGFFSLGSETPTHPFDWPEDTVSQHEISHNFNAPDHGYYCQYCVMCYYWAWNGVNHWCPECQDIIDANVNYQG